MASSTTSPGVLFEDIFEITAVNPDGQKFRGVSRIHGKSEHLLMEMRLDVNSEVYPVKSGERITVALASTLHLDGTPTENRYDPALGTSDKPSLMDRFEYVMNGKVFTMALNEEEKTDEEKAAGKVLAVCVSFGGLLMEMKGDPRNLSRIENDQRLFLLTLVSNRRRVAITRTPMSSELSSTSSVASDVAVSLEALAVQYVSTGDPAQHVFRAFELPSALIDRRSAVIAEKLARLKANSCTTTQLSTSNPPTSNTPTSNTATGTPLASCSNESSSSSTNRGDSGGSSSSRAESSRRESSSRSSRKKKGRSPVRGVLRECWISSASHAVPVVCGAVDAAAVPHTGTMSTPAASETEEKEWQPLDTDSPAARAWRSAQRRWISAHSKPAAEGDAAEDMAIDSGSDDSDGSAAHPVVPMLNQFIAVTPAEAENDDLEDLSGGVYDESKENYGVRVFTLRKAKAQQRARRIRSSLRSHSHTYDRDLTTQPRYLQRLHQQHTHAASHTGPTPSMPTTGTIDTGSTGSGLERVRVSAAREVWADLERRLDADLAPWRNKLMQPSHPSHRSQHPGRDTAAFDRIPLPVYVQFLAYQRVAQLLSGDESPQKSARSLPRSTRQPDEEMTSEEEEEDMDEDEEDGDEEDEESGETSDSVVSSEVPSPARTGGPRPVVPMWTLSKACRSVFLGEKSRAAARAVLSHVHERDLRVAVLDRLPLTFYGGTSDDAAAAAESETGAEDVCGEGSVVREDVLEEVLDASMAAEDRFPVAAVLYWDAVAHTHMLIPYDSTVVIQRNQRNVAAGVPLPVTYGDTVSVGTCGPFVLVPAATVVEATPLPATTGTAAATAANGDGAAGVDVDTPLRGGDTPSLMRSARTPRLERLLRVVETMAALHESHRSKWAHNVYCLVSAAQQQWRQRQRSSNPSSAVHVDLDVHVTPTAPQLSATPGRSNATPHSADPGAVDTSSTTGEAGGSGGGGVVDVASSLDGVERGIRALRRNFPEDTLHWVFRTPQSQETQETQDAEDVRRRGS